jgi:hypothetical protein
MLVAGGRVHFTRLRARSAVCAGGALNPGSGALSDQVVSEAQLSLVKIRPSQMRHDVLKNRRRNRSALKPTWRRNPPSHARARPGIEYSRERPWNLLSPRDAVFDPAHSRTRSANPRSPHARPAERDTSGMGARATSYVPIPGHAEALAPRAGPFLKGRSSHVLAPHSHRASGRSRE